MKKSLLFRLFGVGKLPAKFAMSFAAEGVILSDEGLRGSVTYRNFHRPGSYSGYRRVGYVVSIVVTKKRIAAYVRDSPIIDVPFTDERLRQMAFSVEENGALLAAFDASLFHGDWSGNIEYRFKTPLAQAIVDHLRLPVIKST